MMCALRVLTGVVFYVSDHLSSYHGMVLILMHKTVFKEHLVRRAVGSYLVSDMEPILAIKRP